MKRVWRVVACVLLAGAGAAVTMRETVAQGSGQQRPVEPGSPIRLSADCASLKGMTIPASSIGLPTGGAVIETAVAVAATEPRNVNGDFCKVTGVIRNVTSSTAVFEYEVNLPA